MARNEKNQPHAICIPFPAQSHIIGMTKVAKLLHHRGFHITFVNTEFNQNRLIKSGAIDSLTSLSRLQFRTIPDGLPPSDPDATQDIPLLCGSVRRNMLDPFRKLVVDLNGGGGGGKGFPPVSCIVSDGIMPFTVTVAKELGIPVAMFWTFPACAIMGFYQYRALIEKGLAPLKDSSYLTNGFLDTEINWIPGMKDMDIRLKDLPTFLRTTDPDEDTFNLFIEAPLKGHEADAVVIHTFYTLEKDILDAFSSMFPRLYTIGPLRSLLKNVVGEDALGSSRSSLWKDDPECIEWLNSKKPGSVIYINFGSILVMSPEHLVEFAMGLANSNHYFLWIIRRDIVVGNENSGSEVLPSNFLEKTRDRGMISSWCQQEEVLNHPSVGGFLTHSGWNSTMDSLASGVQMICWPFFADQQTICKYVCTKWEVGMEIDSDVKRDQVEKLVRELLDGENGKKMRKKALEWKKLAKEANEPHESSFVNFQKLVDVLLSKT